MDKKKKYIYSVVKFTGMVTKPRIWNPEETPASGSKQSIFKHTKLKTYL